LRVVLLYFKRHMLHDHKDVMLDPTNNTDYRGNPYPFGMDPVS